MDASRPTTTPPHAPTRLATLLAAELRAARTDIVRRWLDRIVARVTVDQNLLFPTDELLDHVPLLVDGIAAYVESEGVDLEGHGPVEGKAMELGALRHAQGFDAYQILKEHEILSGILFTYLGEALARMPAEVVTPDAVARVWRRVAEATDDIRQATMTHFLRVSSEQVRQREERLRRFNRMVSHELKNRVGAIRGASTLLGEPWLEPAQRERFLRIIAQNGEGLQRVLENLTALSRLEGDSRRQRNVLLPQAAAEVIRQLRDAAKLGGIEVRIDPDIPTVEVDAAAVELCLANYISNAIKYADPKKPERFVDVSGELIVPTSTREGELIVRVRDNGIGVPPKAREHLFEQFFRAHNDSVTAEGTGLGLNIVQETVASLGGRSWAEFPPEGGSVFAFSLPSRREEDAAAAGTRRPEVTPEINEAPAAG
ncbi:MAG: sensor histidine kinase [Gemmatimonadaceae bacterium]|nr:sensor histidine kinase [Gemmatimonadaceae bacterium]NUO95086.1 sensor histidine kinase [Gemmatimonadaceae bacterium]NUP55524.1 sensor histidine kinase [Gemmatimonadaceae bacterium]NUP70270.1 sensor histidine kinase [Gemmatimonadaceae bacterium]NUR36323.1 sensor histidine kinase [Gemmatimonadaceae bacterium]